MSWRSGTTARRARLLGATALLVAGAPQVSPAHAAARVITVSPGDITYGSAGGDTLAGHLAALEPGDTLVLRPGVYRAGFTRPNVRKGTASAPITVVAADRDRTLIQGQLKLWDADHWHLRNLRVQATVPGGEALWMGGGRGWQISGGEFFGGRSTGAYANVAIGTGLQGSPAGFRFTANCVHGAGRTARENTDHNIYVGFAGGSGSGGIIDRNVIFDHPNGAGVKLGFGGQPGARGPWGVRVVNNTIAAGGRQVLLHGDVRHNVIQGNLLAFSTEHFRALAKTTAIYVNMLTNATNRYGHNYVFASSMVAFDPARKLASSGDNALRGDPRFSGTGSCRGWRPQAAAAGPYGRFGTGRFSS